MKRITLAALALVSLAYITACDKRPETPAPAKERTIFEIIEDGDTTAFVYWLELSPDLNQTDAEGTTPLIASVIHERLGYAIDLIGHGADVNLADQTGATALHVAAMTGHTPLLELLIESGADITKVNRDGLSAYDLATLLNQPAAASTLSEALARLLNPPATEAAIEITDAPVDQEISPALLLSTDFRIWTSASGEKMEAAFIQSVFDTVTLQNRDGEFFRIPVNRLAAADQITVRQLSGLDPHALARARASRTTATSTSPRDSLALRIARDNDMTILEGCRLMKSEGNDGDSFYAKHDGKEYIFRLYFVDAAETMMSYPDRVRHQAEYFGLSDSDTIKLGEAAKKFTTSLLASGPFTVTTKWEDAKGNSRLPRHFALVVTDQGDLDELLVAEGLVRRYGMPIRTSLGQRKQTILKRLEEEAKQQKAGAWGKQDSRQAKN